MFPRRLAVLSVAGLTALLLRAGDSSLRAQSVAAVALTGQISSADEGPMEGVVVSAKRAGATVTISVVSDATGRYRFPRMRLEPGPYSISTRAVGYELDDPGPVEIASTRSTELNLKLHKTQDLSVQLTNGEWLMSFPGTADQKRPLTGTCPFCHTLERVVRTHYTAAQWPLILQRMSNYAMVTSPLRPQLQPRPPQTGPVTEDEVTIRPATRREAEYYSSLNLSSSTRWQYPLKTLPRPKGKGTRVIVTEYDLPRADAMPHDVLVDTAEGVLWYPDFGHHYLGRLDPKTAKVVEYPVPVPIPGAPTGSLDAGFDRDGNIWFAQMYQSGVVKFDKKTETFQSFPLPKELYNYGNNAMIAPQASHVDGKVWMNHVQLRGVHRVDVKTGRFETFEPYKQINDGEPHQMYGISSDSQNNLYLMDLGNRNIVRIDAKTGQPVLYPTPTPGSGPRRGHFDSQDRLWFAEFWGNQVAMFDARSHEFKEWALPPYLSPYDAVIDRNGDIWTGGMSTDRVVRVNSKTGETIGYLLPHPTNIRRVDVDNSTDPPTLWVGNNHGASIIKVEPID
jgi:virginiamycin B lyase